MKNYGLQNEVDIIKVLNGKYLGELPKYWFEFITSIFPMSQVDDTIHCKKAQSNAKEDIIIFVCGKERSISIKSGENVSVHEESLNRFCGFLRWLGVEEELIDFLKIYHYGDMTNNGSGNKRYSLNVLNEIYKDKIKIFNDAVNKPDILIKIVRRFLAFGTTNQNSHVNFLFYGTKKGGIYCNMKHLCDYIVTQDYSNIKGVHFGPFSYNAKYRGLSFNELPYEEKVNHLNDNLQRHYINIKWYGIEEDMKKFIDQINVKSNRKRYFNCI